MNRKIIILCVVVMLCFSPACQDDEQEEEITWEDTLVDYPVQYCQEDVEQYLPYSFKGRVSDKGSSRDDGLCEDTHYTLGCSMTITLDDKVWSLCSLKEDVSGVCAVHFAHEIVLCGYSDWRLPNIDELVSLYDSTVTTEVGCGFFVYIKKPFKIYRERIWSNEMCNEEERKTFDYYLGSIYCMEMFPYQDIDDGCGLTSVLIVRP